MTCQGTCSSSRTFTEQARRVSVEAGGHHTATEAARLKDRGSIVIDLTPHGVRAVARANGQGYGMRTASWFADDYWLHALGHIKFMLDPDIPKAVKPVTEDTVHSIGDR